MRSSTRTYRLSKSRLDNIPLHRFPKAFIMCSLGKLSWLQIRLCRCAVGFIRAVFGLPREPKEPSIVAGLCLTIHNQGVGREEQSLSADAMDNMRTLKETFRLEYMTRLRSSKRESTLLRLLRGLPPYQSLSHQKFVGMTIIESKNQGPVSEGAPWLPQYFRKLYCHVAREN